ncbi:MAG TPA: MFS transporter [Candidatus Agrococcus pullicola]|uniref:MFS transporter n=1 Tax=Candidatus Agrococcus pullicola TaxID=2838429 RepID=A0A9D2C901_9MICO|nr:MFS transporter [Candidatus Agrococcus pullicola]
MRRVILLALLQCAVLGALTAPAVVGLSVMMNGMTNPADAPATLAMAITVGGVAAMVASTLFGWLSDRTRARKRWLVSGALIGMALSAALPFTTTPLTLAAIWGLTQIAYNACFAAINGLVSEGLDASERTRASGFFSAATFIGTLPGLAVAALFPSQVVLVSLVIPAATTVIVLLAARRLEEAPVAASSSRKRPGAGVREVITWRFVSVLLLRMMISMELTAGLIFGLYLFMSRWDLAEAEAVRLVSASTLLGAVGIVLSSLTVAATRIRLLDARALLAAALLVLVVAMLLRGLADSVAVFVLATGLAGTAIGLGMTATRSLAHAALPPDRSALGLGVLGVANSLGGIIAPPIASALLIAGGSMGLIDDYAGMYVLLVLPIAAGLALIPGTLRASSGHPPRKPMPVA